MKRVFGLALVTLVSASVGYTIASNKVEIVERVHTTYVTTKEPRLIPYTKIVEVPVDRVVEVEVERIVERVVEVPTQVFDPFTNEFTTDAQAVINQAYADLEETQVDPFALADCADENNDHRMEPCVWDAHRMGNGEGRSLWYDLDNEVHYID